MIEEKINKYLNEMNYKEGYSTSGKSEINKIKEFLNRSIRMYKQGSRMGGDEYADFKEWAAAYQYLLDFINRGMKL